MREFYHQSVKNVFKGLYLPNSRHPQERELNWKKIIRGILFCNCMGYAVQSGRTTVNNESERTRKEVSMNYIHEALLSRHLSGSEENHDNQDSRSSDQDSNSGLSELQSGMQIARRQYYFTFKSHPYFLPMWTYSETMNKRPSLRSAEFDVS
jgi:hypothetical protein